MSNMQQIDTLIKSLQSLISDSEVSPRPPEELIGIAGIETIYNSLLELRTGLVSIGTGELSYPITSKGYLPSTLKSLQLSLQHMIWQLKAIVAGDLTQSIDFGGDFSEAFNSMTKQLEVTLQEFAGAENLAREAKEHFELIFNTSPDPTLLVRLDDGLIANVNHAFLGISGYTREEVIGKTTLALNIFENTADRKKMANELTLKSFFENLEMNFRKKNGGEIIGLISAKIITLNGIPHSISVIRDITDRKEAEETLRKSEERLQQSEEKYRLLVENSFESILVVQNGHFKFSNPMFAESSGYLQEELLIIPFVELIHPDDRELVTTNHRKRLNGEQIPRRYQFRMLRKDSSVRWVEQNSILIQWEGNPATLTFLRDITDSKESEEEILYLSYHDQLTGLYNRRFYEIELKRLDTKRNLPITLVMADVNGLKLTNDAFGHIAGDKLIKRIGEILRKECRTDDIAARVGGDEFVLLLPKTSSAEAEKIVQRINVAINNTKIDHTILSVSFGWGTKNEMSEEITNVYTQAEDDMYRHKLSESTSMKNETIKLITKTLYEKNEIEQHHCERVSELCRNIGTALGLSSDEVNELAIAGLLHDIGNIAIDGKLLTEPGKLTQEEWIDIKRHPEIGYQILRSVNKFSHIAEFVLSHHERLDGSGYPRGLKDKEIPLQSKILFIAEAYDAMINDRIYKPACLPEVAIKELKANANLQFDAHIAQVFVEKVLKRKWDESGKENL